MRLRRKPWVDEAIHEFDDFVTSEGAKLGEEQKGHWAEKFGREAPLHVELGCGKGDFISQMAERCPEINFVGIEMQQTVLYTAAKKVAESDYRRIRTPSRLRIAESKAMCSAREERRSETSKTRYLPPLEVRPRASGETTS